MFEDTFPLQVRGHVSPKSPREPLLIMPECLSPLNDNYLQWLDELFSIDHGQFNNFFVTGTNGKTTTTHFLSDILSANNIDHGSVGTLGTFINKELVFQNQLTTEEPTYIRSFLDICNKKNIDKVLFEASSIGIDQGRLGREDRWQVRVSSRWLSHLFSYNICSCLVSCFSYKIVSFIVSPVFLIKGVAVLYHLSSI